MLKLLNNDEVRFSERTLLFRCRIYPINQGESELKAV